jgi:glycosyl hydrolase family 25
VTLVNGLDVSNWTGADIPPLIEAYQPAHLVARLSTESQYARYLARQQLEAGRQAGLSLSGYIWCSWDASPEERTADALSVASGFDLATVWFDAEEGNPGGKIDDWLSRAVDLAERRGFRAGVYCNAGWWRAQGDSQGFKRLPLWLASWNGLASLDVPPGAIPGGWTVLAGHQYQSDPDLSVFDRAVTVPADPCRMLREGLAAALTDARALVARLEGLELR